VGSAIPSWICLGRIVPTVCIWPSCETHSIAGLAAQGTGFTAADGRGVILAAVLDGRFPAGKTSLSVGSIGPTV
jgi:hypothetical protein